jgi:DNA-binding XRE family transcriptional regulator
MALLTSSLVIELRAALGVSQAELAELAGISRHTVMRTENGRTVPSPLVQAALARVAEDYLNSTRQGGNLPIQLRRLKTIDARGSHFKKKKANAKK